MSQTAHTTTVSTQSHLARLCGVWAPYAGPSTARPLVNQARLRTGPPIHKRCNANEQWIPSEG